MPGTKCIAGQAATGNSAEQLSVSVSVLTPVSFTEKSEPTPPVIPLTTDSGVRFAVWPRVPDKPTPTLFVLASTTELTLGTPVYRQAANTLGPEGFLCVAVDLPCHGTQHAADEPEGLAGWRHRCDAGQDPMAELCGRLSSVLDHLIRTGRTDPEKIAVCGTSRGGFSALHFAAADSRVRCVAAWAPVTELTVLQEFHGAENNTLVQQLSAKNLADKLAGKAVWIIIGDRDLRVGTDDCIHFARQVTQAALLRKLSPQVHLHVIPEPKGHTTPQGGPELAAAWIREQLN